MLDRDTNAETGEDLPPAITYMSGIFSVVVQTSDEDYIGYYRLRITATALDDTGVDINTETRSVDFEIVIYQIETFPLEDM